MEISLVIEIAASISDAVDAQLPAQRQQWRDTHAATDAAAALAAALAPVRVRALVWISILGSCLDRKMCVRKSRPADLWVVPYFYIRKLSR